MVFYLEDMYSHPRRSRYAPGLYEDFISHKRAHFEKLAIRLLPVEENGEELFLYQEEIQLMWAFLINVQVKHGHKTLFMEIDNDHGHSIKKQPSCVVRNWQSVPLGKIVHRAIWGRSGEIDFQGFLKIVRRLPSLKEWAITKDGSDWRILSKMLGLDEMAGKGHVAMVWRDEVRDAYASWYSTEGCQDAGWGQYGSVQQEIHIFKNSQKLVRVAYMHKGPTPKTPNTWPRNKDNDVAAEASDPITDEKRRKLTHQSIIAANIARILTLSRKTEKVARGHLHREFMSGNVMPANIVHLVWFVMWRSSGPDDLWCLGSCDCSIIPSLLCVLRVLPEN